MTVKGFEAEGVALKSTGWTRAARIPRAGRADTIKLVFCRTPHSRLIA